MTPEWVIAEARLQAKHLSSGRALDNFRAAQALFFLAENCEKENARRISLFSTDDLAKDDAEGIRARMEAVPEGPWTIGSAAVEDSRGRPTGKTEYFVRYGLDKDTTWITEWAVAEFIARAREDMGLLLRHIERLELMLADAEEPGRARSEGRKEGLRQAAGLLAGAAKADRPGTEQRLLAALKRLVRAQADGLAETYKAFGEESP